MQKWQSGRKNWNAKSIFFLFSISKAKSRMNVLKESMNRYEKIQTKTRTIRAVSMSHDRRVHQAMMVSMEISERKQDPHCREFFFFQS